MKIAVTGGSGRLGANLVREILARGHSVRALAHDDQRALAGLPVELVAGDVRNPDNVAELVRGVDAVVHMAAKVSLVPADRDAVLSTNVEGTRTIAAACRRDQVRLVHVASIHAFDPLPLELAIDESRPLATTAAGTYDRSKALGLAAVEAEMALGLDAVIICPTGILGPNDWRPSDMGQVLVSLAHRIMPGLVAGDFDWVDARDASRSILVALEKGTGRYILSGHRASIPELARFVHEFTGVRPPRMVSPMWLARASLPFVTGLAALMRKPPLYSYESLQTLRHFKHVSGDRAARELQHRSRSIKESIFDQLTFYREQGMIP